MTVSFSIVTVTRNDLDGLRRTAASIAAQTFRDFDWLIIDGASTDGTVAALAAGEFPGACFTSEPDRGLYDAMNKGLAAARGNYLSFMNSGDGFADPAVLADVAVSPRFGEVALIYGDAFEIEGERKVLKKAFGPRRVAYTMFAHHQAMFYRRADVAHMEYDLNYRIAADWVFTAQLLKEHPDAAYLARPICCFERGGLSQSKDPAVLRRVREERARAHREVMNASPLASFAMLSAKGVVESVRRRFPRLYDMIR